SPCNNVCRIDERSGWCLGCWRSIDEIAAWSKLDDAGKRAVLDALPLRRETSALQGSSP
ncbi:MAG TPA: DUF1289 domain-containing protein, partial [Burkholderiaceae bacterium]|nr:DUF1289 domain-containing protein [Burkholderiaceae bacterium]